MVPVNYWSLKSCVCMRLKSLYELQMNQPKVTNNIRVTTKAADKIFMGKGRVGVVLLCVMLLTALFSLCLP